MYTPVNPIFSLYKLIYFPGYLLHGLLNVMISHFLIFDLKYES